MSAAEEKRGHLRDVGPAAGRSLVAKQRKEAAGVEEKEREFV